VAHVESGEKGAVRLDGAREYGQAVFVSEASQTIASGSVADEVPILLEGSALPSRRTLPHRRLSAFIGG
jgi:hypothetical protein